MSEESKTGWEALGFESFEAYDQHLQDKLKEKDAEIEKREKRLQDREKVIGRQSAEVSDARKQVVPLTEAIEKLQKEVDELRNSRSTSSQGETASGDSGSTGSGDGDEYSRLDEKGLISRLDDNTKPMLEKAYQGLTPEERKLVKSSPDARAEFMRGFFREVASDSAPSDSFLGESTQSRRSSETLEDRIRGMFRRQKQNQSSGIPDVRQSPTVAAQMQQAREARDAMMGGGSTLDIIKARSSRGKI